MALQGLVFCTASYDCVCHAPIPSPTRLADPHRVRGARPYTETLYLFFLKPNLYLWVWPTTYNRIKISYTKLQIKITTVVVFTVSYTYSFESHLHIQNYTLHLHDQSAEPTVMNPYWCAGPAVCGRSRTSSSVPARIKNPC